MALIYLANDLIKLLNAESNAEDTTNKNKKKKQAEPMSLYREFAILGKQVLGKELTKEEQAYDNEVHELDVMGEVLNGIKYKAGFSLLQNVVNSAY